VGVGDENLDLVHEEGPTQNLLTLPKLIVLETKHRATMAKGSSKAELLGQMRVLVQQRYAILTLP
jgi:hypothetical protein